VSAPTLYCAAMDADSFGARLLLGILGIDHVQVPVDVFPATDPVSRKHLSLTTNGALPFLQHDGQVVEGLMPVLRFIGRELDPEAGFRSVNPEAESWLIFAADDLRAAIRARHDSMFGDGPDAADVAAARAALLILEDHLTARRLAGLCWVAGSAPTIADIALYPAIALIRDFGLEHHEFPALRTWLRDVRMLAPQVSMPGILDPI
jgi:glutathione S-transferase